MRYVNQSVILHLGPLELIMSDSWSTTPKTPKNFTEKTIFFENFRRRVGGPRGGWNLKIFAQGDSPHEGMPFVGFNEKKFRPKKVVRYNLFSTKWTSAQNICVFPRVYFAYCGFLPLSPLKKIEGGGVWRCPGVISLAHF